MSFSLCCLNRRSEVTKAEILAYAQYHPGYSYLDIADEYHLECRAVLRALKELEREGEIEFVDVGRVLGGVEAKE